MSITQIAAALALVGSISGGVFVIEGRYAKVQQVASNSQGIMILQINLARDKGDRATWQRLCDDFQRLYNWLPRACQ